MITTSACEILNLVESCEGGGLGGGGTLPSVFIEETQFTHNIMRIINNEKWKIDKMKKRLKGDGR